jgi:hypothetical protein
MKKKKTKKMIKVMINKKSMLQGITKKIKIIMDIIIITHMEVQKNTERKKEEQIKNIIQKIMISNIQIIKVNIIRIHNMNS